MELEQFNVLCDDVVNDFFSTTLIGKLLGNEAVFITTVRY